MFDGNAFCRSCCRKSHRNCFLANAKNKHDDDCLKCIGECVRDRDGDLWFQIPNGTWVMDDPIEHWVAPNWQGARTLENINESYGPIKILMYLIREEEELMFA